MERTTRSARCRRCGGRGGHPARPLHGLGAARALHRRDRGTDATLDAFVHLDLDGPGGAAAGRRRADRRGRTGRAVGRRALRGEGPRGLRRDAHLARFAAVTTTAVRSSTTRSTWRACGRRGPSRSARPRRRSSARCSSPAAGRRAPRATRGTRPTPGGSSGGSAAAVAGGHGPVRHGERRRRVHPHPGGLHRAGRHEAEPRSHPPIRRPTRPRPRSYGVMVTHGPRRALATSTSPPDPHDADRTSLPAPGVVLLRTPSSRSTSAACGSAWSPDLGFAVVDPEVGADRAGRPRCWPRRPGPR